jgi:ABC-type transport system involved in multi-copper enzyme maturation permease subunit
MSSIGLGPVFALEWRLASRRWQFYAARGGFVIALLIGLWGVWSSYDSQQIGSSMSQQASVGRNFYIATAMLQLGLVGLSAPAAAAGAICQDKANGNLTLMFASDLSNSEIVLGKLAGRLVPVLGLIACTYPVTAMSTLMGGVDPIQVTGSFLVLITMAAFGCSLALVLSVWGRKMHEVLLTTYAFGILWTLLPSLLQLFGGVGGFPTFFRFLINPLLRLNPVVLVIAPIEPLGGGLPVIGMSEQLTFLAVGLTMSVLMILVAALGIRRAASRSPRIASASKHGLSRLLDYARSLMPGPSLDANPVLWREWHRSRPGLWSRFIWAAFTLGSIGLTIPIVIGLSTGNRTARELSTVLLGFQVAGSLLLLSIPAATSLAEERQQGSIDILLTTPLRTRSIVLGKWLAAFRQVPALAAIPTFLALVIGITQQRVAFALILPCLMVAYGAALVSLGLAMATWQRRLDRAIGLTTTIYVVVTVALLPLAFIFESIDPNLLAGISTGSPFYGPIFLSQEIFSYAPTLGTPVALLLQVIWCGFWIAIYSLLAAGLLCATLATFNRCLGRMDERDFFGFSRVRSPHHRRARVALAQKVPE